MAKLKKYIGNLIKYVLHGGVTYVNVSFVNASERYKGHKVFISGGSEGLGRAMAEAYINEGRTLKRRKAASHSRVAKNYHRTSHIYVCITDNMTKKED